MNHEVTRAAVYDDTAVLISWGQNNGALRGKPFRVDEWVANVFIEQNNQSLAVRADSFDVGKSAIAKQNSIS